MITLIRFTGASMRENDNGEREYTPRGPIWINPDNVSAAYDHTILTNGNSIRVMEDINVIVAQLTR